MDEVTTEKLRVLKNVKPIGEIKSLLTNDFKSQNSEVKSKTSE